MISQPLHRHSPYTSRVCCIYSTPYSEFISSYTGKFEIWCHFNKMIRCVHVCMSVCGGVGEDSVIKVLGSWPYGHGFKSDQVQVFFSSKKPCT